MKYLVDVGSAVGQSSQNNWGQVIITPHAYGVIEIETYGEENARNIGIRILSELSKRLANVNPTLISLTVLISAIDDPMIKSLILLVPDGDNVSVVMKGNGRVYLKRGDILSPLLVSEGSITGQIRIDDSILLASGAFTKVLSDNELAQSFDHLPASEAAEKLTLILHTYEGGYGASAIVYKIVDFENQENTALSETPDQFKVQKKLFTFNPLKTLSRLEFLRISFRFNIWRNLRLLRTDNKLQLKVLIIILFIFFVISVGLGIYKQRNEQSTKIITVGLEKAEYGLNEGIALLDLNKSQSRLRLEQALSDLSLALNVATDKTSEGRKVLELKAKIDAALSQANQIQNVVPTLFYDVSLIKKESTADQLILNGNNLYILDRLGKTVFFIDTATKNAQILAGGDQFLDAKYITFLNDKIYTLTNKSILETKLSDKKTQANKIVLDRGMGGFAGFSGYGGNLYIVDTTANEIWRYLGDGTTFSKKGSYLNPDEIVTLGNASSMSIDGSIWVTTNAGQVLRFTQNKLYPVELTNLEKNLGSNLVVFTSEEINNFYVADNDNNRIVVFDKEGNYNGQYIWKESINVSSFAVSESSKRVFITSGGTMYAFDLN